PGKGARQNEGVRSHHGRGLQARGAAGKSRRRGQAFSGLVSVGPLEPIWPPPDEVATLATGGIIIRSDEPWRDDSGLTNYVYKPKGFLERLYFDETGNPVQTICCAGFEFSAWRCIPFAEHLVEWLPEYALPEDELAVNHANIYVKLKQAAIRVYTSEKYKKRGEVGEIALHAICREFFGTVPISPRVFYKSSTNDVVKAFDLVHARFPPAGSGVELWLGESKLYADTKEAIAEAHKSVTEHIEQGFLNKQKLLLGPQISKQT